MGFLKRCNSHDVTKLAAGEVDRCITRIRNVIKKKTNTKSYSSLST